MRIDISPLRTSRDFRLIFASGLVTYLGSMITYVALPFQVAQLTGSFLAVGLIGLAELVPLVLFGLYGGALADAVDRRVMVIATEAASAALVAALLVNSLLPSPQVWVLYIVAMLLAAVDGLQRPSLEAMIPRVVAHDQLAAAAALTSIRWQLGSILGPAIGGLLLSAGGAVAAYGVDVTTFLISVVLLWRLRSIRAERTDDERPSLRHVAAGVRYAWSRKDLLGTYAVDLIAMTFAFPYALFPFLAEDLGAPWALGLLYSAGAVGSLVVTLTSGWTSSVHRHGRAIVISAALWGVGIGLVGVTDSLWWVLLFLTVRRWRRHGQRHLPQCHVESDHPRRDARTDGRYRTSELLNRTTSRTGAQQHGSIANVAAHVLPLRRNPVRRRCWHRRNCVANHVEVRRSHKPGSATTTRTTTTA